MPKNIIEKVDKMRTTCFIAGWVALKSGKYTSMAEALKAYGMQEDEENKNTSH